MFYCISDEIEILSLEKMMSRVICNKCTKDGQEAQLISKMFLFMIVKMQDCDFYLEMKLYLSVLRNSPHLIHYTLLPRPDMIIGFPQQYKLPIECRSV